MTDMQIALTRVQGDPLKVTRKGESLIFNGTAIDLSGVTADAPLLLADHACPWIASDVTRDADGLHLTVIAPYAGTNLPEALWYPDPLVVVKDGPVALPAWQVG